jgi:lysophospholipase L1-like esterase
MIKKFFSWLVIITITMVLFELVLRFFDGMPVHKNPLSGFHMPEPTVGWIGRPNYRGRFKARDFDVVVENDALGFRRSTMNASQFSEDAQRIVFLGDSMTWGWGVENDEVLPEQLQKLLGTGTIVNNFAVNAFGTAQQLLLYDKYVSHLKPDVVVLMFVANDLRENLDDKEGRRPWFELVDGELIPRNQPVANDSVGFAKSFAQKSVAISTLRYSYHVAADGLKSPQDNARNNVVEESAPEEQWELFAALLGELQDRCGVENLKCELKVVYAPGRDEVHDYATNTHFTLAARLKTICDAAGISYLDLRPGIYDAWQKTESKNPDVTPIYFQHDGHMDAEGLHATAQILFDSWALSSDLN